MATDAKLNRLKGLAGAVAGLLLAVAILAQSYWVAGWIGGAIPAPGGRAPPPAGVPVWIEDNGIHTGIVLPKSALPPDMLAQFSADDLADPRFGGHPWLAIGWGDRAFYLGTPTWSDLRAETVLAAAVGSDDTVLHVEHVAAPRGGPAVRRVLLRPQQLARLIGFIRGTMAPGGSAHGYGDWDAFYPARGHYSAIRTCNAWTGEALRAAEVPMGRWTPFSGTVMWWL